MVRKTTNINNVLKNISAGELARIVNRHRRRESSPFESRIAIAAKKKGMVDF